MGGGGSEKWLNSFMGLKKSRNSDQKVVGKGRKWKLWRTFSGGLELPAKEITFNPSSMATAVKVSDHKNSCLAAAAIRIQSMFRAFLARRALRALKAVVRIQAIFRGRRVRNEAAVTLKRMQALVRIQGRIMAMTKREEDEEANISRNQKRTTKEKQWCDSIGTAEEVKKQDEMKKEGIIRRERAIAYYSSLSQQQSYSGMNKPRKSTSRLQEEEEEDRLHESVKVRKNLVSTRISAKPMMTTTKTRTRQPSCSFSESNVETTFYDDGMTTSSSSSSVNCRHGRRNQLDLGCTTSKPNNYTTRSNKMIQKQSGF